MIFNFTRQVIPEDIDLQCPICKQITTIHAIRQVQWGLDCLYCCKTEGVPVVFTQFNREEKDRTTFTEFQPTFTKMHIKLPNDNGSYVWKFDYKNSKTILYKVGSEFNNGEIHRFDEIIDINLENFVPKTKMCLLFG